MGHEHDDMDRHDPDAYQAELRRREEQQAQLRWKRYDSLSRRRLAERYRGGGESSADELDEE